MTNKYKISEMAKDFGIASKELTALVLEITGEEKKSGASLGEREIGLVFDALTKKNSVKSFDEYFASGAKSREENAKKRQDEKDKKLADQRAILEQLKAAAAMEAKKNAPKEEEKPVEKISLDDLTFGTKYGQDIDPTRFYRELEDGLRAMAHSQSFLNLQPYRVIVDTDQIVLVGIPDNVTKEADRHLNYGIAMFNFISVVWATRDTTPKWSFAPVTDRDLGLPADVKYVAKCKL